MKNEIRAQISVLRELVAKEDSDSPIRLKMLDQIDELKKDFQEVCYELELPEEYQLAELLHKKQCHWNHTDGCSWDYESWKKIGGARQRYVDTAVTMLEQVPFKTAKQVLELM